jgi:UDP-N-acetylmuramoyl-L-alanyl-D-glutamate--2,6-diaminopimelate ligase
MPDPVLSELIQCIPGDITVAGPDVPITGLTLDSRQVQPGYLFVACPGGSLDGHHFIADALRRGACAVVGTERMGDELPVPYVRVRDSRQAMAYLSAAFYGFPARKMMVIGVTGTDGKTTTCNLIYQILRGVGIRAGMISTVNAMFGDQILDTGFHVTTPDAPDIQRYLGMMVQAGLTHVVLEATSHGLAQQRVAACDFDIGVITNITHEHLDYHGTYEAYQAAKGLLFTSLFEQPKKSIKTRRGAVLNVDDSSYGYLNEITQVAKIGYGLDSQAQVRAENIQASPDGLSFNVVGRTLRGGDFRMAIETPLVGLFNVSNCLAAIAATAGIMGMEPKAVRLGIANLEGVPGRMERISLGQDFTAIVDFAHTPNSLQRALETARTLTDGRVIAVFGCAGERDVDKRPWMGEISARLADVTVMTAEDPRTESLEAILAEMARGAEKAGAVEGQSYFRVPDRAEAIQFAVDLARPGDLVIACGKGHEQSMCFGAVETPWSEHQAMRAALRRRLGNMP